MNVRSILRHAFSTQKSNQPYTVDDAVQMLGVLAILVSLISGSFLFLYLLPQAVPTYAKMVGFSWMMYAELLLIGMILHDNNKKRHAAYYFIGMGVIGLLIGAGFFLGGATAIIAGIVLQRQLKR